jgi:hypothetical protein
VVKKFTNEMVSSRFSGTDPSGSPPLVTTEGSASRPSDADVGDGDASGEAVSDGAAVADGVRSAVVASVRPDSEQPASPTETAQLLMAARRARLVEGIAPVLFDPSTCIL